MKIFDLTHQMNNEMPVYPGMKQPEFKTITTVEKDGWYEKAISFSSHIGTHIDSPAHIIDSGETLDRFGAEKYFGRGCKIDFTGQDSKKIDLPFIKAYKDILEKCDFVLFYTGWSNFWSKKEYFENFPTLTADAAEWLCSFQFKGIGFDTISADCCSSTNLPIHKILLGHKKIIIENLTGLNPLPAEGFFFSCFPLKIEEADGSPVRAAAILFNNKDII